MRDEVAHVGIVYGLLRFGFPRIIGAVVVWEDANHMDVIHIFEGCFRRVDQLATKDEVQTLCHFEGHSCEVLNWAQPTALGPKPQGEESVPWRKFDWNCLHSAVWHGFDAFFLLVRAV